MARILELDHDIAFAGVALHGLVVAATNNELGVVLCEGWLSGGQGTRGIDPDREQKRERSNNLSTLPVSSLI